MSEAQRGYPPQRITMSHDPAQQALGALGRMSKALTPDDIWDDAYRTLRAITSAHVACFEANARELLTPVPGQVDPEIGVDLLHEIAESSERAWFRDGEPAIRAIADDRVMIADCTDAQGLRGAIALVFEHAHTGQSSMSLTLAFIAAGVGQALGRLAMQATTMPLIRHHAELERNRVEMSRALHDGPAQDLAMASMALEQLLRSGQPEPGSIGGLAADFLERAILGLRRFISELRGEERSFAPAVKAPPTLVSLFPDDPQEQAILAITREALRNVRKHAEADAVTVSVRRDAAGIDVQITDNGRGFDPARESGHFGLAQMSETASDVGAALSIQSAPGEGTTVRLAAQRERTRSKAPRTVRFLSNAVEKRHVDQ